MKKKHLNKQIMTAVLALSAAVGMTACGSTNNNSTVASETESTVLKVGYNSEPASFDPADFTTVSSLFAGYDCYDTLLNFTADGTDVAPAIADSWEKVDGLTYTYHIREGVKFSDGNDLTMEDILYSLNRVSEQGYYMSYLFACVDSFEVDEATRTLTVHLKYEDSTWKYIPATSPCCIVEKSVAEAAGDSYGSTPETTAGTGPYKLVSWASGSEIVMEKNEYWWGDPATLPFETVEYYIIEDESSLAMAAKSGQVDFVQGFSGDVKSVYDSISDMTVMTGNGTTAYYMLFNTCEAPFDDVNARKAVLYCLDKSEITSVVGGAFASECSTGVIPASTQYMDTAKWADSIAENDVYTQDYDKVAECLAASAYPDGFSFDYYYSSRYQKLAEMIQAQVNASGLITMNIVEVPSSDFFSYMYGYIADDDGTPCYNAGGIYWMSDYLDPIGFLSPLYSSAFTGEGGTNMAQYINSDVDALLNKAAVAVTDSEKVNYYTNIYAIVTDDVPYCGLYSLQDSYAISNKFSYTPNPMLWYSFTYADFKVK